MSKEKGKNIIIIAFVIGFLTWRVASTFPWIIAAIEMTNLPDPPKPSVTYGEFPFRLEYELNGEVHVIEDILVCEFAGVESRGAAGKYREWNEYIKSTGGNMVTLLDVRDNNDFTEWGNQVLELCFDPGKAAYYMGDTDSYLSKTSRGEWIDYLYLTPKGEKGYSAFTSDEAWEKYGIRIIKYEPSKPIENIFEK